ncbi:hypothetical protein H2200_004202 [Cladophialophora chaetospira]|uniref:Mitochondrial resolvase Ydc2 catalytic domain-containing protein n=1 Tax=Cladophialophora chaetospira TaxID=386627 RepID=A0AA39CLG1_9EURO|nr:hypothetical protein H2200_004202 [Cladophialophora chaetospira]
MPAVKTWLEKLTIAKLHRLAVELGAPCSGTKAARIEGIRHATTNIASIHGRESPNLSLLSIDMGIKNLAFAHITAPLRHVPDSPGYPQYEIPTLQDWRRLAVSDAIGRPDAIPISVRSHTSQDALAEVITSKTSKGKESFDTVDYAKHAYTLINYMLKTYRPNHILIERQRFRSGGGSAVQEWSIRVGVFEGMLYSVLRTLTEERNLQLGVEPMQPPRVNRYWLENDADLSVRAPTRLAGRDVKKAKIGLVGDMLGEPNARIRVAGQLHSFATDFVSNCKKVSKSKRGAPASIPKLDDLADSLLQGLAWVE